MKTKMYFVHPGLIRSLLVASTVKKVFRQYHPPTTPWLLIGILWLMVHGALAQTDGFTTSFNYNDGTTYDATLCANDMGDCNYWSNTRNSQIYDGNLRIRFEANRPGTTSGITSKLDINGDRVYSMEYKIRFDGEFQWREGGKLPGLAGGQAPSGGTVGRDIARAGNGFSTRFMWRPGGKLVVYTYYRDQTGDYGDDWDCNFTFYPNVWYTLKQKVTVNTGSNYDGRVEVWVDGVKKLDKNNVRLMTNNNRVNVVFFDTFMGGGNTDYAWSPTQTQYLRIDDVQVVKGGEAPAPTEPDAISLITAPDAVTPGGVARVKVSYFASTNRDLQVDLQGDGNPNYNPYGSGKIAVPAGNRTVEVEVPVNSSIPLATDAYQFQVYLSPTDQGWSKRTASQAAGGVDAVKTTSPNPTATALHIRAKGSVGSEQMSLWIADKKVQSWTVATTATTYSYPDYTGGVVRVSFDNDGGSGSSDRNLAINHIRVCGIMYQSNGVGVVRTGCGVDNDQGFAWLWCSGSFDFGNLNCTTNARQVSELPKTTASGLSRDNSFVLYPNPAAEQLTVRGSEDYQVAIYDLTGRSVMRHEHLKDRAQLDIRHLRPGVYVVKLNDGIHQSLQQRLVVE